MAHPDWSPSALNAKQEPDFQLAHRLWSSEIHLKAFVHAFFSYYDIVCPCRRNNTFGFKRKSTQTVNNTEMSSSKIV